MGCLDAWRTDDEAGGWGRSGNRRHDRALFKNHKEVSVKVTRLKSTRRVKRSERYLCA